MAAAAAGEGEGGAGTPAGDYRDSQLPGRAEAAGSGSGRQARARFLAGTIFCVEGELTITNGEEEKETACVIKWD